MEPELDIPINQIRRYARGALAAAGLDANSPLPLPIDEIASAAGFKVDQLFELGDEQDLPPRLQDVIRRLKGRVLGALSFPERRIYVDTGVSYERGRFTKAHETGHGVLKWHQDAYFGDDRHTLDTNAEVGLEAEANQFAAEVVFGIDRFTEQADSYKPSIDVPLALSTQFGASAHASFRRYVVTSEREVALIVTGRYPVRPGAESVPIWNVFHSAPFLRRYGPVAGSLGASLGIAVYPEVGRLMTEQPRHVDGCSVALDTSRGMVTFDAEGFANGHAGFVLLKRRRPSVGRSLRLIGPNGQPL